jgi:subfamily B ATP-binding cassette protein MsbA
LVFWVFLFYNLEKIVDFVKKQPVSLTFFGSFLKAHVFSGPRWVAILGGISMIMAAMSTAALTQWVKPVIDDIFIGHQADRLLVVSLGVFFIFFLRGASEYISQRCTDFMGERLTRSLQARVFSHVVAMNVDFFRTHHEGVIMSLLTHDVQVIRKVVIETMVTLLKQSLMVIFLAITMVQSSFTMVWIVLWLLPITGFLLRYCQTRARDLGSKVATQTSELSVFFQQIFQNIVLVKSSNTELKERFTMNQRMGELWAQSVAFSKVHSAIHPVMDIVAGISIAVGIFFVGQEVIAGEKTVGSFFTFVTALVFIYPPIKNVVSLNTKLQEGLVSAQRISNIFALPVESSVGFDLDPLDLMTPSQSHHRGSGETEHAECGKLGTPSTIHHPPKGQTVGQTESPEEAKNGTLGQHDWTFENLTFSYPGSSEPIFQNFSCRFFGGKKMALVGNSGAGKTTLFYLLLRLYQPEMGRILIGNRDLQDFSLEDWRQNVAFVGQEMALFSDTVAANISYGMTATPDQIAHAASMAYADEFIDALPKGYDTLIGTRGLMLSGGQRQRLALARAFLRNSPIVLLDEATSALDATSEKKIKEATFRLMENRTTLMIAHRFSTIEAADVIYVLDQGRMMQQGQHHELMAEQGLYQKWAMMQKL